MIQFSKILNEKILNFFQNDKDEKREYVDDVWDILQYAYKEIGGIQGSGFANKEDMVNEIPMWKVIKEKGKVEAVILYKDKNGRKLVAAGATKTGKNALKNGLKKEIERSYFEVSSKFYFFLRRLFGDSEIKKYIKTADEAEELLKKPITRWEDLSSSIQKDYADEPWKNNFYGRKIGGELHAKLMIGTPGEKIKSK